MSIVNARIHYSHNCTFAKDTFFMKFIYTSHIVNIIVGSRGIITERLCYPYVGRQLDLFGCPHLYNFAYCLQCVKVILASLDANTREYVILECLQNLRSISGTNLAD
jgi:hypothetical protein